MTFLAEWGSEIILSLIIAVLTYYFKKADKEKDAKLEHYQKLLQEEKDEQTETMIEEKIAPLYDELEDIRRCILSLDNREKGDMKKVDENFKLIIASYKYRLVQLCKELLNQGFMYQCQYEHLNEFYNLYHSLGGNGQAKDYYDKVCSELEIRQNPT